jgi:homoserine kinase
VAVRIPASSANLGPGYDSFGLALALYDEFEAEAAPEWSVDVRGHGEGHLLRDGGNLVARACSLAFDELGGSHPPAAAIVCRNGIPTGRGLGSSSAAIVGGVMLGHLLAGHPPEKSAVLDLASRIEGHPDNVGAAVFGGFTVCYADAESRCASIPIAGGIAAVVVTRDKPLPTTEARRLLPGLVPHEDASFNAAHAGLVVAGITLGRADLLAAGLHDRLHEQYRASAVGDLDEVREILLAAGADGAALSGAGPTVVGIVTAGDDGAAFQRAREVAARADGPVGRLEGRRTPFAASVDRTGAVVR